MAVRIVESKAALAPVLGGKDVVHAEVWRVRVEQDGQLRELEFDHEPSDAEIISALPAVVVVDPGPTAGRQQIYAAVVGAASDWYGLERFAAAVAASGDGKQLTALQDLVDRAFARVRRLVADYADATAE